MKSWRKSATIIIAARNRSNYNQKYDYNLLFLKRHQKANAFANLFVFPGGVIESADSNLRWQKFFNDHGYNENSFKSLFPYTIERPEIFYCKKYELPREISLRICAIRETFEECGILLCKNFYETTFSSVSQNFMISFNQLEYWQNKVHNDANEFYNMCETLKCVPNLWILYEWGNWLSPSFISTKKRFNTIFFFTYLPQIPNLKIESNEIEDIKWSTPEKMELFKNYLPIPQQYEIQRIEKYKQLDKLIQFASENAKRGVKQFLPIQVKLLDGIVLLLPGDTMYLEKINLHQLEIINKSSMTIKEFRQISSKIHRIEYPSKSKIKNTKS